MGILRDIPKFLKMMIIIVAFECCVAVVLGVALWIILIAPVWVFMVAVLVVLFSIWRGVK